MFGRIHQWALGAFYWFHVLKDAGKFGFSISPSMSFGRVYLSVDWSVSSDYEICPYGVVHSISLLSP